MMWRIDAKGSAAVEIVFVFIFILFFLWALNRLYQGGIQDQKENIFSQRQAKEKLMKETER